MCESFSSSSAREVRLKLFFLTHDDERAPAAAASGERRKSVQALRSIDLQTRSADLDVFVYIATDKTPLLCQNPAVETRHPPAMAPTVGGETHHGATVRADPTALSQAPLLSVCRGSASFTPRSAKWPLSVRRCVRRGGVNLR